jgi:hypothetical protein
MEESLRKQLVPGAIVEIIQQIPHRDRVWTDTLRGTVLAYEQRPTGSWYTHSRNDRLWLDRLVIRKADGEITTLILDDYTSLKIEQSQAPAAVPAQPGD